MNREIKFRAWEKPYKSEDGLDDYKGEMHFSERQDDKRGINLVHFYHDSCWDWDNFIFMQYTGLKDKNGKEIYENDIVKYDDGDNWEVGREVVKFENGAFNCICYNYIDEKAVDEPRIIEIIGNIHEHKHLLK